jgi:hypothetical protein
LVSAVWRVGWPIWSQKLLKDMLTSVLTLSCCSVRLAPATHSPLVTDHGTFAQGAVPAVSSRQVSQEHCTSLFTVHWPSASSSLAYTTNLLLGVSTSHVSHMLWPFCYLLLLLLVLQVGCSHHACGDSSQGAAPAAQQQQITAQMREHLLLAWLAARGWAPCAQCR